MTRRRPEILIAAAWLLALLSSPWISVSPDIHWQLWMGRHMNAGVPIYDWIMETNPPLWFWMAQAASWLAAMLGARPEAVMVAAVMVLAGLGLLLVAMLAQDRPERQRAGLLAGVFAGTIVVCLADFGQREHEALIGIVPYAVLIALRVEGRAIAWPLALAVGLFAAPMIALKHYFVLLPVVLEIWLIWRLKRWQPFRPETLALAGCAIAYALAVILLTPAYLRDIVPMLSLSYGDAGMHPLRLLLNRMTPVMPVLAFYIWHYRRNIPPVPQALLLVTGTFFVTFYLQAKGWDNHLDPVLAGVVMVVITHWAFAFTAERRPERAPMMLAAAILLLVLVPVAIVAPYRNVNEKVVGDFLDFTEPGMSVATLTTRPVVFWPMVIDKELRLPSRYYHYWMLPRIAFAEAAGDKIDPRLSAFADDVRRQTVEDYLCNPPDIIIEDRISVPFTPFDILAFFKQEPRFATLFAAYEPILEMGQLVAYRRIAPLPPPPEGVQCMPIGVGRNEPGD